MGIGPIWRSSSLTPLSSLGLIYLFKTFVRSFRIILNDANETAQYACLQRQNSFGIINVVIHKDS